MRPIQQTRRALTNAPVVIGIVVVVLLATLAIPLKVRCGAPGRSCATAVDPDGYVHHYYEVEPLGVFLAEIFAGSNIEIFYTSGEDLEKAG